MEEEQAPGPSEDSPGTSPSSLQEMTQTACVTRGNEYHHLACFVKLNATTSEPACHSHTSSSSIDILEQDAYQAIKEKNCDKLKDIFQRGLCTDHIFSETVSASITNETLLQVMVKENFDEGITLIFSTNDVLTGPTVQMAFLYAMRHNITSTLRVFLQGVIDGIISMDLSDAFCHGMYKSQYDLVAKIIHKDDFNVNLEATWRPDKPLHIVVHHSRADLVRMLLEKNALVDAIDRRGTTPLIIACSLGSLDCIRLLLIHGANPNHKACRDLHPHHSPLHAAFRFFFLNPDSHSEQIVALLLRSGLNMREETWILSANSSLSIINNELTDCLQYLCTQPQELKMSCFHFIRRLLFTLSLGESIVKDLNKLSIPPGIKRFLKLDDI